MADEKQAEEFIANPTDLDGVPDLSMLVYLQMENVLYNLEFRYRKMARKHCYTSVSTVLVAINPYERLPIYGQDVIDEFHSAAQQGRLPQGRPHPYGVSARSYMRLIQRKANQSIVVCGESGAGKTETTKLLMRYLALTAPSASMESSMVEQQIIAASPILEAYGNAKTLLNNNSSRFGKFTKLLYDVPAQSREGHILGSYLETYLLEKSRVVKQAQNERNYHIFYFLFHGLDQEQKDQMQLIHPDNFFYTNQGNCAEVPGVNDVERYQELYESMGLMRIDEELQRDLWRLTIGILHLGNVEFKRQGDGFAEIADKCTGIVECVAGLWGITPAALAKRLTTASMTVSKKKIEKKITYDTAPTNRDSITKALYENCFNWLCSRINAELYQIESEEDLTNLLFIGILDVFGFENFVNNSLEQFCINFTNEKLQQFFNFHIIRSEQEEYIKESVFWTPLSVPDNLDLIQMIEDKKWGFFTLLDSACSAPQPSVEAWQDELFRRHGDNPTIKKATSRGTGSFGKKKKKKRGGGAAFTGFELHHFADEVIYNAEQFLSKNMEAIHPDTAKMLKKSDSPLVVQIGGGDGKKKKKKKSVTAVFFKALITLMKNLHGTEPFFVRCVNPNKNKSSKLWHVDIVEHQLRCGGLVEALRVLKLGYPTRVPYNVLYEKYHSHVTNPLIKSMNPESFSTAILIAFDVSSKDYELGLTKIFFKPAKAAVLDTIMAKAGTPLTEDQNRKITRWVVKKRLQQSMGLTKSFLALRMQVRMERATKSWQHVGRVGSILATTCRRTLMNAREVILERKKNMGAQMLQTFWRSANAQVDTRGKLDHTKEAVAMIWRAYRQWDERAKLQTWLDVKVEETRKRLEEEERERMEEEQRRALEEKRQEEERLKMMADEERRAEEMRLAEARRLKVEEAKRKKEEEELEVAREAQRKAQLELERQQAEEEKERAEEERIAREKAAEESNKERKAQEQEIRKKKEKKIAQREDRHMKETMPETFDDYDEDDQNESESEYEDESDEDERTMPSLSQQLRKFPSLARTGQLFLKYTGKRRRKPQDRIVKVSFDGNGPKQISWGSGSRHIDFNEIRFVAWGHKTPVFEARRDQLDEKLCFSVVGRTQILDVSATSRQTAELWVKGLRRMLNQSDEEADRLAEEAIENGALPGAPSRRGTVTSGGGGGPGGSPAPGDEVFPRETLREHKKRTKSLMLLQQDLFVMTTTTVLRTLEEERIWVIDQEVRDRFNAKLMYEQALRSDIPWRRWNTWIREQIVTYLREAGKVIHPQDNFGGGGGGARASFSGNSRSSMSGSSMRGSIGSMAGMAGSMNRTPSFRGAGMNRQPSSNRVAFVSRTTQPANGRSFSNAGAGGYANTAGGAQQPAGGYGGNQGGFAGNQQMGGFQQQQQRGAPMGGGGGGPPGPQGENDQCALM